jgi:hypothetical protein
MFSVTPRIYGMSKLKYRQMWLDLRLRQLTVDWVARWPTLPMDYPDADLFTHVIWPDCEKANVGLVYLPDPSEQLRGALLEMGYLRGRGCPLILLTPATPADVHVMMGDFAYCPELHYASTEAEAIALCHQLVQRCG